jgi:Pentapeptide repeats (8 copies)
MRVRMNDAADQQSKPTSAEPELRKVSVEELERILEKHKEWLADKVRRLEGVEELPPGLGRLLEQHKEWFDDARRLGWNSRQADLSRTDLREHGGRVRKAQLHKANLSEAQLQGAYLMGAQLRGAHLERTQLQGANLNGADLQGPACKMPNCRGPTSFKPISAKQTSQVRTLSGWPSRTMESRGRSALLTSPMQISATPI